jgi:5-formyltetrahydrofolate cyclo-ligase
MSSIIAQKERLRTDAAQRCDAVATDIGEHLRDVFERTIAPPPGIVVSGYYPIGSEANVRPLMRWLLTQGFAVALPVVTGRGEPLIFRQWLGSDTAMDTGPFGIREPRADSPPLRPDVMLTPLLAFDRAGNRLGYGGGFYDRTIKAVREHQPVFAIGVAYAVQEVANVPHDDNDTPLDRIITENGAIQAERGNS